ncbi:TRAP-type C4-dicarboxylate transport system permease small subunit [Roseibium hamelinense]|uniref:TRAP transporter small permease protein n=1 Tax=Roseibium hamelinense TaxID=150831 RepID=A0A562T3N5_9HYPH|nr:TRAP transporter small permease [Roseibium hamelinense]MTI43331.1 TRAP transporter small permease [Roseibium hamelinense]TWI87530.1 TRAP-type C4-dicarboxylate transport system permease small subunit [Roseibium hamelinense]
MIATGSKGAPDPDRPETYIKFSGALGHVENAFNMMAAVSILALMLLAVVQILGRLFFNTPIPGFIDITEQVMAIFAFAGVAYCQRVGGHIRMEIVIGALKGRVFWLSEMIGVIIIASVVALLVWGSWYHFQRSWTFGDSTMDIGLPTWPSKLIVPVALSLLLMRLLLQIYGYARLVANPDREPVDVPVVQDASEHAQHEIEETMGSDTNAGGRK